jgi:hypothetical protein
MAASPDGEPDLGNRDLIVIGGSAGAVEALRDLAPDGAHLLVRLGAFPAPPATPACSSTVHPPSTSVRTRRVTPSMGKSTR